MGKYVKSPTKGILKILGQRNPELAVSIATTTWERNFATAVRNRGEEMRANYIVGIRNYINNPQKQRIAEALLTDWYNNLMPVADRYREIWSRPETYQALMNNMARALEGINIEEILRRLGYPV